MHRYPQTAMQLLDASNVESYLRATGRLRPQDAVTITRMEGGVSNEVLYVSFLRQSKIGTSPPDGKLAGRDFVLKQAREQLRVPVPWYCGLGRNWREVEIMRACRQLLEKQRLNKATIPSALVVPDVIFEDRDNYCFAMTAAPREHMVWNQQLLAGQVDLEIARHCGLFLAALHGQSWRNAELAAQLGDDTIFDQLRLDPYYRFTAKVRPEWSPHLLHLVENVRENRCCLVHADFSPKNILVCEVRPDPASTLTSRGLLLVDFETGHFGDGAFDLGFFLSHLLLKAIYHRGWHEPFLDLTRQFWHAYTSGMLAAIAKDEYGALVARAYAHLAGCLLARVDGKSKVEYLTDETARNHARRLALGLFEHRPATWDDVLELFGKLSGAV